MVLSTLYVAALVVVLFNSASALPLTTTSSSIDQLQDPNLVKRMNRDQVSFKREHDTSCQCLDCYIKLLKHPVPEYLRSIDIVPSPVWRVLGCPTLTLTDCIMDEAENALFAHRNEQIVKSYKKWLQDRDIDPSTVKVIFAKKEAGASSSSSKPKGKQEKYLTAPLAMHNMDYDYELLLH